MIVLVKTLADVEKWWPFFEESVDVLNDLSGARADITKAELFDIVLRTINGRDEEGQVAVLCSKNEKPLAYGITCDCTEVFGPKTWLILVAYTNGKQASSLVELLAFCEKQARSFGYKRLQAHSRRITGAAMRLFEKKWGFERHSIAFTKDIL